MTNIDRRMVLAGVGAAGAATLLAPLVPAQAAQLGAIGLQLYTVREAFAKDPAGTLAQVARIGYREIEFGGGDYDKMDHAMLRRTMDKHGLKAPSIHVPYEMLTDQFDAALKMTRTLGAQTVVMPWLDDKLRGEAEAPGLIAGLNRIGEKLHKAKIGFAYHNHDFEFTTRVGNGTLYDRLVQGVSPSLLKFELDLYWATFAGQDMPALIDRLGARLYAFHVKDMRADKKMTAVGTGMIDFAALFKRKGAAGVHHFYVENDEAAAPYFPDITTSFRNLRALRF